MKRQILSTIVLSVLFASCGGGGGSSVTAPISGGDSGSGGTDSGSGDSGSGDSGSGTVETLPVPDAAPAGDDFHPEDKGWVLSWSDEFDGDALNRSKWEVEESCWGGGNDERQCYTDREENVQVVNGLLRLIAYPENYTGPEFPQGWPGGIGGEMTRSYTSGKLRTRELASWTYGRFSARMKLPKGQGTWPAFWMLPAGTRYGNWAASGEIDIMEAVNLGAVCTDCEGSERENRISGALHYGNEWPNSSSSGQKTTLPGGSAALDDYHVFALEWGEGRMNWFVDGEKFMTLNAGDWFSSSAAALDNPNAPFDTAFYQMLNLAVGGTYPDSGNEGGFNADSFPSELLVDWVRVYVCEYDGTSGRACMDGESP